MIKISPSILSSDFANLASEIKALDKAGADMIHIDVMDGNFVPTITIGPLIVQAIRPYTDLPLDVHLMIENPERHIEQFAKAGADIITVHYESTNNSNIFNSAELDIRTREIDDINTRYAESNDSNNLEFINYNIALIKSFNKLAGISLKPETNANVIDTFIDQLDLILIMTVNPGMGGQQFIENQVDKIREIYTKIKKTDKSIILSVDGGIDDITAKYCINAGATMLVSGSFIFKDKHYKNNITKLRL